MPIEATPLAPTQEDPTVTTNRPEAELVDEVGSLWKVHVHAHLSLKKSRADLKTIRVDLSRKLYELKSVLSRPGRGGAWSSFLGSEGIPRSTADRLVRAHEKAVAPGQENCTTEQIPEPREVTIHRYFRALWPKLSQTLTTPDAVEMFIAELRYKAEQSFGATADALQKGPGV
jgi:hypothetical protein